MRRNDRMPKQRPGSGGSGRCSTVAGGDESDDASRRHRDIDFLCSMFDEMDRDLMVAIYEQRQRDVQQTLEFLLLQEGQQEEEEEEEDNVFINADDDDGKNDEELFSSLMTEEDRQIMIAEMKFYERMKHGVVDDDEYAAAAAADDDDDDDEEEDDDSTSWEDGLTAEQREAICDLCAIFSIDDREAVCAVLIALEFDKQAAFEQLSLQLDQFVEHHQQQQQQQKKKRKRKFERRDDLLGARYGLIRSQWNIPKTTVQLARQMKIEKLKKTFAPYASDAAIDAVLRESDDDMRAAARRLKKLYPSVNSECLSSSSTSSSTYQRNMEQVANSFSGFAQNVTVEEHRDLQLKREKNKLAEQGGRHPPFRRHKNHYRGMTCNELRNLIYPQRNDETHLANRREVHRLVQERNRYYTAAANAYVSGDTKAAKALSNQGREQEQQLKEINQRAGHVVFIEKHAKFDNVYTVDMHGLLVDEALDTLERQIDALEELAHLEQNDAVMRLRVITGKGLHSQGNFPRIKEAVIEYLRQRKVPLRTMEHDGHVTAFIRVEH